MKARLLLLTVLLLACGRDPGWPGTVAAKHGEADRLLDRGDRPGARRVLASIVESAPAGDPTRRPLLQDTHFRLARLALPEDPTTAAREAEAGLALGDQPDLFTANLLIVRAAARERLGQGPAAAADYEHALRINEALLREILPSP